ncbi:MAG TPA: AEC family transporter [Opitutaceae bacterium]|nr:AEC family transporter [Opitutaceae bacterium]
MFVFNTLAPVFLLIALGAALFRLGFLGPELTKGVNRLAYWVALPALLFQSTATAGAPSADGGLVLAMIGALAAVTTAAFLIARMLKLPPVAAGTFVHVAMRGNVTFVGVPVVFYVLEATAGGAAPALKSAAILALAPFILVQNVIGFTALLAGRHEAGGPLVRTVLREIATHPLLISIALGLLVAVAGWELPVALDRSLHALGAVALPVTLLGIGASLMTVKIRGNRQTALLASALKIGAMPLAGWALGTWLGLARVELMFALVYLGCPTGASSFTVVAEMGGDEPMASTTIVLSTLISAATLAWIVAWY